MIDSMIRTLDGVCLDELAALLQHILWDGIPCHALGKAEVDVRRAEIVDVEPGILRMAVSYQVLVLVLVPPHIYRVLTASRREVIHHPISRSISVAY